MVKFLFFKTNLKDLYFLNRHFEINFYLYNRDIVITLGVVTKYLLLKMIWLIYLSSHFLIKDIHYDNNSICAEK